MKGKQDQTARPFGVVLAIVVMIIALLSVLASVHPNGKPHTSAAPAATATAPPTQKASPDVSSSQTPSAGVQTGTGATLNGTTVQGEPTAHPVYTVKQGDCLWTISQRVYGDANRWRDLARANHLTTPYTIYPGQELKL